MSSRDFARSFGQTWSGGLCLEYDDIRAARLGEESRHFILALRRNDGT